MIEQAKLKPIKGKHQFGLSGYYFIALIVLALLGFWPTYFSTFVNGTGDFKFYFHFHAIVVFLWILLLIAQPILVVKKRLSSHRLLGNFSYLLFPLIFISVILVSHNRHPASEQDFDMRLLVPFKDLIILSVAYSIAIFNRHNIELHARGMIVTGLVFIEPALIRFINYANVPFPTAYFLTIAIIFSLLITLIFLEGNQKKGRWIFPLTLGMYLVMHTIIILEIRIPLWASFAKWFASLSIT